MNAAPFNTLNISQDVTRRAWWLYVAAVASSLPTLWFYLVGEEGILVNSSLEMWQRGDWLRLWLYGVDAKHGVFANWLVILISSAVGWERAPGAVRAIMIGSTALSGLMLAFLVQRLYRNAALAALAAAIAVTFIDILMYRGWLGYRDPLLGMLIFGAIAALWMAVETRRAVWLFGTLVLATLAFLTKGIIAYAFVGAAALVFLCRRDARDVLLRPVPLLVAAVTLSVPFLWSYWTAGDQAHNTRMATEIGDKLMPLGGAAYVQKLITYPLEALIRLAPVSLLVAWWTWKRRGFNPLLADQPLRAALAISGIAFVAFWLAPQTHFRYLLPVLPLIALVLAVAVCRFGDGAVRTTLRCLWAVVILKFLLAAVLFPMYQQKVRGENYAIAAHEVLQRTAGFPLYTQDVSAAGLSVTAYMNLQRLPRPALTFVPDQWDNAYAISNLPDEKLGKVAAKYPLGGDTLYLLCRGVACER
jgi:4-amino-4-deoxy-L-arabinose transferase-like glycosyltransferase